MENARTCFVDTTKLAIIGSRLTDEERAIIASLPQTTLVRNHLYRFKVINEKTAREVYGITRLASVIYRLRFKYEPLMNIVSVRVKGKNRFGKSVEYVNYTYKED